MTQCKHWLFHGMLMLVVSFLGANDVRHISSVINSSDCTTVNVVLMYLCAWHMCKKMPIEPDGLMNLLGE